MAVLKYEFSVDSIDDVFFTADHHFGHKNIIKNAKRIEFLSKENLEKLIDVGVENRDCLTITEQELAYMEYKLSKSWNRKIKNENSLVFVLGDFCTQKTNYFNSIKLNGNIVLLPGNHDYENLHVSTTGRLPESIRFQRAVNVSGFYPLVESLSCNSSSPLNITIKTPKFHQDICLFHYPILEWEGYYRNTIHLYGHCHGTRDHHSPRAMDVGVDLSKSYSPFSLKDVLYILKHGKRKTAYEKRLDEVQVYVGVR